MAGRLDEPAAEELRVDVAQENLCADTVGPNRDADDTMEWTASDTEPLMFWVTLNAGQLDGISTSQRFFSFGYL